MRADAIGVRTEARETFCLGFAFLRAVPLIDPRQEVSYPQNLLGVDGNVRGLAGSATRGL